MSKENFSQEAGVIFSSVNTIPIMEAARDSKNSEDTLRIQNESSDIRYNGHGSLFLLDTKNITNAIRLLHPDGELFEIRLINGNYNASGYFTDADTAIKALQDFRPSWNSRTPTAKAANLPTSSSATAKATTSSKSARTPMPVAG